MSWLKLTDKIIFGVTDWIYKYCFLEKKWGLLLLILIFMALIISGPLHAIPSWLKINLSRNVLGSLLQALIALLAIFSAIVVSLGYIGNDKIDKRKRLSLWKDEFFRYFKYIFVVISCDLAILILPTYILDTIKRWGIFELLSLLVVALNLYAIFLVIKATERHLDIFLEP